VGILKLGKRRMSPTLSASLTSTHVNLGMRKL